MKKNIRFLPTKRIRFKLRRLVGSGSFGKVYEGTNIANGQKIAIKKVEKKFMDPNLNSSTEREFKLMLLLDHPNVVKLYDFQETTDEYIFVLDFCGDGTISDFFKQRFGSQKERVEAAPMYIRQIVDGLHHLHTNKIFHRDLKPENLLMRGKTVKIVDFGMSRTFTEETTLMSGWKGSLGYASPEYVRSITQKIDLQPKKIDIWALGVTILDFLGCAYPLSKTTLGITDTTTDLRTHVSRFLCGLKSFPLPPWLSHSPELKSFITACLTVDPDKRYTTSSLLDHPYLSHTISRSAKLQKRLSVKKKRNSRTIKDQYFENGLKAKDRASRRDWYYKGAVLGHPKCQYNLGLMCEEESDSEDALKWFLACLENMEGQEKVQVEVMDSVGRLYHRKREWEKAVKWYRKSGARGHAQSQYHCGLLLLRMSAKNEKFDQKFSSLEKEGWEWMRKAAESGVGKAKKTLKDYLAKKKGK